MAIPANLDYIPMERITILVFESIFYLDQEIKVEAKTLKWNGTPISAGVQF